MPTIPIGRLSALVDDVDFEELNQVKWARYRGPYTFYAYRIAFELDEPRWVAMHRYILGAPHGVAVDHINGNGLDNRRFNLRLANDSLNQANRHRLVTNTSGYRGVTLHKGTGKWQAGIKVQGHSIHLGLFERVEDAARAYDAKALELFGEFARPNFGGAA